MLLSSNIFPESTDINPFFELLIIIPRYTQGMPVKKSNLISHNKKISSLELILSGKAKLQLKSARLCAAAIFVRNVKKVNLIIMACLRWNARYANSPIAETLVALDNLNRMPRAGY